MAANSNSEKTLSPKFTWPAIVGLVVFAVGQAALMISPEMLGDLGGWENIIHKVIVVIAMALTAYYKRDPLRQNHDVQAAAADPLDRVPGPDHRK